MNTNQQILLNNGFSLQHKGFKSFLGKKGTTVRRIFNIIKRHFKTKETTLAFSIILSDRFLNGSIVRVSASPLHDNVSKKYNKHSCGLMVSNFLFLLDYRNRTVPLTSEEVSSAESKLLYWISTVKPDTIDRYKKCIEQLPNHVALYDL
jgi:hypothetical protein